MPSSCTEKCKSCSPSLSIFSILVTANMPVEGFSSFVYDPNDTMPYKNYFYKDKGNSNSVFNVVKTNDCDRPSCPAACPPGGGWDCAGAAAGVRTQSYGAQGNSTSSMKVNITEKGNYRNETNTTTSKTSNGSNSVYESSWTRRTEIKNKYINGALDPSSTSICDPAIEVPNPLCGYDPDTCERGCTDYPYTKGGCSNSTSDIPWMPAPTCETSKTNRKCNGIETISPATACPSNSYYRQGTISSQETVASQVTEAEILSMARQAATTKVNLKKQNQNTRDENQDITEDGSCCRFSGDCDGAEGPYSVNFISDCDYEDDDCALSSTVLPTTCNCSQDKDECWSGYSNITTPSEFSYTNITIGAFKIATNINKEEFSKTYKSLSGTVYFYIDSESELETTPCCTSCGGIECFTGEILGTSSYSISAGSNEFKQNTRIAVDLDYSYDSSELYAIHPNKIIKTCYTVDNLQFI